MLQLCLSSSMNSDFIKALLYYYKHLGIGIGQCSKLTSYLFSVDNFCQCTNTKILISKHPLSSSISSYLQPFLQIDNVQATPASNQQPILMSSGYNSTSGCQRLNDSPYNSLFQFSFTLCSFSLWPIWRLLYKVTQNLKRYSYWSCKYHEINLDNTNCISANE